MTIPPERENKTRTREQSTVGSAPPPPRPYPRARPPKRAGEILACTAIVLGIAAGAIIRLTDRSPVGGTIATVLTFTAPVVVGVVAACFAPQPRLRWVVPRALLSATLLSMATCLPHIDIALGLLSSMPQLAVVLGATHLAVTLTVAGVTSLLASLIRRSLT